LPTSLKAQALEEFNHLMGELIGTERYKNRISIVRRALEQLDD
jgi:Arc/MetJ-type ribon-helix-helix transcriptional regulator